MAYHIAEKQPLRIVGIHIPMVEDMEENLRAVPDFWKSTVQGNQLWKIYRLSLSLIHIFPLVSLKIYFCLSCES